MNLYIQIENENPINHPAFEDNLISAFGSIPDNWQAFARVERPEPGVYQVLTSEESTYQQVNGVWSDVWALRDMTDTERAARQQAVKDAWASRPDAANFAAWTFDESTCSYVPPTARPADGPYAWRGTDNSWVAVPAYPDDGGTYRFDLTTGAWVAQS
jgi:hypothetical protein